MQKWSLICYGLAVSLATTSPRASARNTGPEAPPFSPKSGLLLTSGEGPGGRGPRGFGGPGAGDPLRSKLLDGTLAQFSPKEGQPMEGQERLQWKSVEFGPDGTVEGRGSYLYAPIVSDTQKVLILNAAGQSDRKASEFNLTSDAHPGSVPCFGASGRWLWSSRLGPAPKAAPNPPAGGRSPRSGAVGLACRLIGILSIAGRMAESSGYGAKMSLRAHPRGCEQHALLQCIKRKAPRPQLRR